MTNDESLPLIGITGGIASGKSLASEYLRKNKFHVIDADKLGHQILEPNPALEGGRIADGTATRPPAFRLSAYQQIIDTFGSDILNEDETINRRALGNLVFSDSDQLAKLNQISHPLIRQMIQDEAEQFSTSSREGIVFLEAAILLESKNFLKCRQIWVVDAKPEIATTRLMQRKQWGGPPLSKSEAQLRITAQMNNDDRRQHADVLIENNGTPEELFQKLDKIIAKGLPVL